MKKRLMIHALLLALFLLIACVGWAEGTEETQQDMPLGNVDLQVQAAMDNQTTAAENRFEAPQETGEEYADFYFGSVLTMRGITSSVSLYVNLPEYVQVTGAVLRLSYTCSDLILADLSSMTFYMNGSPFHSVGLNVRGDHGQNVIYIDVPIDLMVKGYNLLEIGSYVRLTDDEGCTDDYNGANWVRILDTTCLRVYYELSEAASETAVYPYPFLSMSDKTGKNSAVAVSDKADNSELTAAAVIMAGLGSEVSTENNIWFGRIGENERENVIYVGLAKNTPADLLALVEQEIPETGALIRRAVSGSREYLLVISNEEEALTEAARLLSDASRVKQLHMQTAFVGVGEAQAYIDASAQAATALVGQYTFTDILGHGASFTGPFNQQVTIYLPVADDYTLSSECRFSLNIRYSENLDFDRSLMTVYWGTDIPLCSRKLTKAGALGETVSFAVPADAVGQSGSSITIVFDLEIKDLDCTVRSMNTPWAFVAADSTLYLPQGANSGLSLGNLPAPFQRSNRMNDAAFVVPYDVSSDELLLLGRVAAVLGSGCDPYGTLKVIRDSDLWKMSEYDYHLIVIDQGGDNQLLETLNEKMYFQYNEDRTALLSNSKLIMNDDFAATAGTVQILQSPYFADRAVLVLSSPATAGLNTLTTLFSTEKNRWSLEKEAVVVDRFGEASAYQFTVSVEAAQTNAAPSFTEVVVQNREPMIMLLAGMGCMVLLLLGAIIILVRVRHRRKNEE